MHPLVTGPAFYLPLGIAQDGITTILTVTSDCSRLRVDHLALLIFISVILGVLI